MDSYHPNNRIMAKDEMDSTLFQEHNTPHHEKPPLVNLRPRNPFLPSY